MGINTHHKKETDLQVGPTSDGMVRIFIKNDDLSLPLDFTIEDALEIADEIISSAKILKSK